jgi:hypothetical protein
MELLRLAMSKVDDPRAALALAREMDAFVGGTQPAAEPARITTPAPRAEPTRRANRQRSHWTDAEREQAADLLDQGVSYAEVGRLLGRTARAIQDMRCDGKLPVKKHELNTVNRLCGALSALTQGHSVKASTQTAILNGTSKQ